MPDLNWTQHKKMNYSQHLRKTPEKALTTFLHDTASLYQYITVLQNQEFVAISWNLVKIAIFNKVLAIINLEIINIVFCVIISRIFQF